MRIGELCIREVVTVEREELASDAARRMAEYNVGDLIVVGEHDGGIARPVGMLTDRDLVLQVLAKGRDPDEVHVREIVSGNLITATEDEDIESVLAKLNRHAIRRIPIVDRGGSLQGIVSLDDVLEWISDQAHAAMQVVKRQTQGVPLRRRAHAT